jgi:hypothetical protein
MSARPSWPGSLARSRHGSGRRIWRPWLWRMLIVAAGATPEAFDFLFKRVHSVRNNRNSRSLMLGHESARSERSPPTRDKRTYSTARFSAAAADHTVLRDVPTCRLQANVASTPRRPRRLQAQPLTSKCHPHSTRRRFQEIPQTGTDQAGRSALSEDRQKHWLSLYFLENDNLWRG